MPSFDSFHVEPEPQAALHTSFVLVVLGLLALHRLLAHYDIPLGAIPETLWNILVHMMPAPLVFALGQPSVNVEEKNGASLFAAKNQVLRRVFGLDEAGMLRAMSGDRASDTKDVVPPGLGNWDNSCYQNSVIQGLASLPSLQRFLVQGVTSFDGLSSDSTNGALLDTVQKLNDPDNHGRHLWTPAKLKNMSSWQQQDAQEYFSKVLDEIDREVSRASRQFRIGGLEDAPGALPESLRNPLEGLLAQRVGCINCGHTEGLSMIPFNCLTVPLQKDSRYGCDIRDCLNEYTKLESIEGVECSSCTLLEAEESLKNRLEPKRLQAVQRALGDEDFSDNTVLKKCHIPRKNWVQSTKSRQAVIGRPPTALVIHVNRSVFDEMTGMQRKNHSHVSFPALLDLGPWSLGSVDGQEVWSTNPSESMISSNHFDEPKLPYQLKAVVSHYGRHENGHYVCYRKHPSGEFWWRLSDEDVSRASKEDVLAQDGVFMLFYEAMPELTRRSSNSTIRAGAVSRGVRSASPDSQPSHDQDAIVLENDNSISPWDNRRTPAPFSFEHLDSNPSDLDPAMRRVIEETIQQEEGGARWSTSRSEYAPSTSEYAPSSASDVSDAGEDRPQSRTSNQSQGLAMRTAGATEQGDGIGLAGLRMVTA